MEAMVGSRQMNSSAFNILDACASPFARLEAQSSCTRLVALSLMRRVLTNIRRAAGGRFNELAFATIEKTVNTSPLNWRPEIGIAAAAVGRGDPELAALQIALAYDDIESYEVPVSTAGCVYLDGSIIRVSGKSALERNDGFLKLSSSEGAQEFISASGMWVEQRSIPGDDWRIQGLGFSRPRYCIASGHKASSGIFPSVLRNKTVTSPSMSSVDTGGSERVAEIENALALLCDSNAYSGWLSGVVDGILVTPSGTSPGSSSPEFPGLIAVGRDDLGVLRRLEQLVGAACQQYLFQLSLVYALTDAGREEVAYVHSRRSYTTVRRALAAAHEHVNIILLMNEIEKSCDNPGAARVRAERRRVMLMSECNHVLSGSAVLTDEGRYLWDRLIASIE